MSMEHDQAGSDEAFAALVAADPTKLSLDIEDMRALVDTGLEVSRALLPPAIGLVCNAISLMPRSQFLDSPDFREHCDYGSNLRIALRL